MIPIIHPLSSLDDVLEDDVLDEIRDEELELYDEVGLEELLDEIAELTEDKNTLWSEFNDIITKNYAAQAESFIR